MLTLNVTTSIPNWKLALERTKAHKPLESTGSAIVDGIKKRIWDNLVRPRLPKRTIDLKSGVRFRRRIGGRKVTRKMPYPAKVLYATGMLYRAIHYYKSGELRGSVGIKDIGSPSRRYLGEIHERGLGRMPARHFFYIDRKTRERINNIWWGPGGWFDRMKKTAEANRITRRHPTRW